MKYIIVFFIFTQIILAQSGSVVGRINDSNNDPIAGVNIVLEGTKYDAVSDDSGYFKISEVKIGEYKLAAEIIGYQKHSQTVSIRNNEISVHIILKEKIIQSEQIVVTAGKYEQQISELPVSASVMRSDEISQKNFTTLDNALRYAPGVSMNQDQVSIRGSSGYTRGAGTRVLVAFDGIPIYSGDTGEINWELIPVTEIDRIEIIKGAASSLYGSSAIGGVINVISKGNPAQPFTYIKTYAGVYDKPAHDEWNWSDQYRLFNGITLTHSNKIDKLNFTISGTRIENQSYKQNDFLKRYIGYLKATYNFSTSSSFAFFINGHHHNRGDFVYWKDIRHALQPPDDDHGNRITSDRYMAGAIYKNVLNEKLFLNVRGNYYNTHWKDESVSGNDSRTELFRGEIQTTYSFTQNLLLVSGIESSRGIVKSNLFSNPVSLSLGAYSQFDYHFPFPLFLSFGVRYDYSKLDTLNGLSSLSPKLGLNYKINSETILRASAGKGFRAPTLAEAFTKTLVSGIPIKPNPKVDAETNYSFEIGINRSFADFAVLDAAFFQNEYYDFIEPGVDANDGQIYFDNLTRARIQGTEQTIIFNVVQDILRLELNYIYLWARDIDKNKSMKYRPRNIVSSKLDYLISNFNFGIDFRYWSKVEELDTELVDLGIVEDGDKRTEVLVFDFNAGVNLIPYGLPGRVNLNLNNAFNYNYIEIIGNVAPIRNAALSLEIIL